MLSLLLTAAALWYGPDLPWRGVGWWGGEPTYAGLPACYWAEELNGCFPLTRIRQGPQPVPYTCWVRIPPAPLRALQPVVARLPPGLAAALAPAFDSRDVPLLANHDPAALPVLVALLDDARPYVRYLAVAGLRELGDAARPAVPRVAARCWERDPYVSLPACRLLRQLDPAAARALMPHLLHFTRDEAVAGPDRLEAASVLWQVDAGAYRRAARGLLESADAGQVGRGIALLQLPLTGPFWQGGDPERVCHGLLRPLLRLVKGQLAGDLRRLVRQRRVFLARHPDLRRRTTEALAELEPQPR